MDLASTAVTDHHLHFIVKSFPIKTSSILNVHVYIHSQSVLVHKFLHGFIWTKISKKTDPMFEHLSQQAPCKNLHIRVQIN